jgi:hypothetical protein
VRSSFAPLCAAATHTARWRELSTTATSVQEQEEGFEEHEGRLAALETEALRLTARLEESQTPPDTEPVLVRCPPNVRVAAGRKGHAVGAQDLELRSELEGLRLGQLRQRAIAAELLSTGDHDTPVDDSGEPALSCLAEVAPQPAHIQGVCLWRLAGSGGVVSRTGARWL